MDNGYPELHLIIIWLNAYGAKDRIIEDIQSRFSIKDVYEVSWSPEFFSGNLSRFYGTKLPPGSDKEARVGRGPFTLVIFEDENPVYGERLVRGSRRETVNTNLFDAKALYRDWTEGPDKAPDRVHSTNTPRETAHDLVLLLGLNPDDFFKERGAASWDGRIQPLAVDVTGAAGWSNMEQLFYVLNSAIDYIVLRNFDDVFHPSPSGAHPDIDLLVENYQEARWIMNASPLLSEPYRVLNEVSIAGDRVRFDLRYVSDNYYDERWERELLAKRVLHSDGFYRPDDENYFFSLLYHAIIHKMTFGDDYHSILTGLAAKIGAAGVSKNVLDAYLKEKGYAYIRPVDKSVCYNEAVISFTARIKGWLTVTGKLLSNSFRYGVKKTWTILMRSRGLQPFRTFAGKLLRSTGVMRGGIRR